MLSECIMARGYFLNSFVSSIWNKRDGEYGCQAVENHTRIVCEIIPLSRACGLVLHHRLPPEQLRIPSDPEAALLQKDAAETAKAFVSAGAQYNGGVAGYGYGPTPFRAIVPIISPIDRMGSWSLMGEYRDRVCGRLLRALSKGCGGFACHDGWPHG